MLAVSWIQNYFPNVYVNTNANHIISKLNLYTIDATDKYGTVGMDVPNFLVNGNGRLINCPYFNNDTIIYAWRKVMIKHLPATAGCAHTIM